jgi:hypothetical protein
MNTNSQKTETQERNERSQAIMAIKYGTVELNSVAYWHMLSII